jgi:hypothetical protein
LGEGETKVWLTVIVLVVSVASAVLAVEPTRTVPSPVAMAMLKPSRNRVKSAKYFMIGSGCVGRGELLVEWVHFNHSKLLYLEPIVTIRERPNKEGCRQNMGACGWACGRNAGLPSFDGGTVTWRWHLEWSSQKSRYLHLRFQILTV